MKQYNFRRNDIVSAKGHKRLMVFEYYFTMQDGIERLVVTEGGYHNEDGLTLVFRKEEERIRMPGVGFK